MRAQTRCGQLIPNRFSHKRHHGMHKAKRCVENKDEITLGKRALVCIRTQKSSLAELNIPVAHIIPEKLLNIAGIVAELIGIELLSCARNHRSQARKHPRIFGRLRLRSPWGVAIKIHQYKTTCVPNLCNEAFCLLGTGARFKRFRLFIQDGVEFNVLIVGNKRKQVVAHGIRAVRLDKIHGIDAITFAFGHTTAVLSKNRGVNVDIMEGNFFCKVERTHDHTCNPKRDDIAGGYKHLCRVMKGELVCVLRPALRCKGPELRREPGIEHIFVLLHRSVTHRTLRHILHASIVPIARSAAKHRNAMSPPELTRNTPVFEVLHPSEVSLRPARGMEIDLA